VMQEIQEMQTQCQAKHKINVILEDDVDALIAALERRRQHFQVQALKAHVLEHEQQQQQQAKLEEEDTDTVFQAMVESIP